ncbi:hypothetical protein GJ496_003050 [Pomphorhynchus laevis]|nr:hypothetical protein GJ496_003050 [Pomphorhynchus laevis]
MEAANYSAMYAALILADAKLPISTENLTKLLKAAGSNQAEMLSSVYNDALDGIDIQSTVQALSKPTVVASASPAAPSVSATQQESTGPSKEAAKAESEDSDDDDLGFGLFD